MITFIDAVVAIACFLVVYYFNEMSTNLKNAVESIKELNNKVGVIIERTDTHSNEIEILRNKADNLVSDVAHIKAHMDLPK